MNGTILNLGPLEILAILIMALLVLGPERLPGLMRGFGTALRRIREMYVGFVTEFRAELQPIAPQSMTAAPTNVIDAGKLVPLSTPAASSRCGEALAALTD